MPPPVPEKYVLVVEDDALTRDALAMTLRLAGYSVRGAGDGEEALQYLRSGPLPAAILLDIVMPNMTGWEFLREREGLGPEAAGVPVIVFSVACEVSPGMPLPRGVSRVLPKPAPGEDVLASLNEVLGAVGERARVRGPTP